MSLYIIPILILFIGLAILVYGADLLIDASISLARHFNFSTFVIGLSVIAFGTSLPEFTVSLLAMMQGSDEISVGNVIGSNIANTALIMGWTGLFFTIGFKATDNMKRIRGKIWFMLFIYTVFIIMATDGLLSRVDGIILLILFVLFLFISFQAGEEDMDVNITVLYSKTKSLMLTIIGIAGLIFGARLMTNSAIIIARAFGIREYVIGATIIAVGTSLPELAASFSAIKKGESAMSIANIIGSNIFNILMVLGLVSIIIPIKLQFNVLRVDFLLLTFISIGLLLVVRRNRAIPRWLIYFFVGSYVGYIIRLIYLS